MRVWLIHNSLKLLLTAAALFTFDWLMINRKRLGLKWYSALILTLLHVAAGVGCVKLFALAEAGFDLEKAGNMSLFGAVFFLPPLYFIGAKLFKRSTSEVFDIFTVPMTATLMLARVNCLITGCCLGAPIGGGGLRWPTREAELVFYLIFLLIVIPLVLKKKAAGRAYPLFMHSYGIFRAVCECFRENKAFPGIFHLSHVWALVSAALGIVILALLANRRRSKSGMSAAVIRSDRRKRS